MTKQVTSVTHISQPPRKVRTLQKILSREEDYTSNFKLEDIPSDKKTYKIPKGKKKKHPTDSVAKTLSPQCKGPEFNLWSGN